MTRRELQTARNGETREVMGKDASVWVRLFGVGGASGVSGSRVLLRYRSVFVIRRTGPCVIFRN